MINLSSFRSSPCPFDESYSTTAIIQKSEIHYAINDLYLFSTLGNCFSTAQATTFEQFHRSAALVNSQASRRSFQRCRSLERTSLQLRASTSQFPI